MKISPITKTQWVSVVKNTAFAAFSAALAYLVKQPGLSPVLMLVLKLVEKTFTTT